MINDINVWVKLFISIYSSISQIHDERIDVWLVFFQCIHQGNLERPHLSSSKMMVPIGNPPQMASRYKVRPQSYVQVGLVSPIYHISCYYHVIFPINPTVAPSYARQLKQVTACFHLFPGEYPPVTTHRNGKPPISLEDFPVKTSIYRGFSMFFLLKTLLWLMESSSSSLDSEELCSSQEAGARSGLAGPQECRRSQWTCHGIMARPRVQAK